MAQALSPVQLTPGVPSTVYLKSPGTIQAVKLSNGSPFDLTVSGFGFSGSGVVPAGTEYLLHADVENRGQITLLPVNNFGVSGTGVANMTVFFVDEPLPKGTWPIQIPTQVVPSSVNATTGTLFSVTVGFGSTTGARQKLNVFNPPNSGVTMTFYAARVFDSNTNNPTANLCIVSGADLNLANAISAVSHVGGSNPPTSAAHCTWEETGIASIPGTTVEVMDLQSQVTQDFLSYPDSIQLLPGNNLLIDLAQSGTGLVVRLTMKWNEGPLSVPTQVINMTTQSASNIVNDGNAAGTGIIEATPSGQGTSASHATNDGIWLLNVLQSGTYHQFLKTQASGNPLQLGQAGDITEILGALAVDQAIQANLTGVVLNGSTSGTATLYQFFQGTYKLCIVLFNNFRNGSAPAQSIALPVAFVSGFKFYAGNITPTQFLHSSVAQNLGIITTLAAAGGSVTIQTTLNKYSFGDNFNPVDTISFPGSQATAFTGYLQFEGI